MRHWYLRLRYYTLTVAASGLFVVGGCGLTDQQLAQIWQAVITAGLDAIVSSVLGAAFPTTTV